MTAPSPHDNRIDYVEFAVHDPQRSRAFYGEAFGWTFTDYGPDYIAFSDGRLSGGLARASPARPGGALVVLYADDLSVAETRIVAVGGQIVRPAYEFPGGRRFHFTDPDGYELAVWSER